MSVLADTLVFVSDWEKDFIFIECTCYKEFHFSAGVSSNQERVEVLAGA